MKLIIALSIAAVAALLIFLYALFGSQPNAELTAENKGVPSVTQPETEENGEPQEFRGEATFAELQELGANVECRIVYDTPDQAEPMTGTYFVSGDKVRADFEMVVPELGGTVVSSLIYNGDMYYSWSDIDGQLYGVSANTAALDEMDREALNEPVSADDRVSYECTEWQAVDGSIFEPPSEVLFRDLREVLESGMEYGTIYNQGEL